MAALTRFLFLSLLFLFPLVHSRTVSSDISALKSFKASIDFSSIDPSSCLYSWNFSADPCSHHRRTAFTCGLDCDSSAAAHVIAITLSYGGYRGTLPRQLPLLTGLQLLDLSNNLLSGPIPPTIFPSLPSLETLFLGSNRFSGSLPGTLTALTSLQSLELSNNSLTGPIPRLLGSMCRLQLLDLSFNRFNGSLPAGLPPGLVTLELRGNSISGVLARASFQRLRSLATLDLGGNLLQDVAPPWLFLLPSLQQLDLSGNRLTGVQIWIPGRGEASGLVAVNLGFNRITGPLSSNFTGYPSLRSLDLGHNNLCGGIPPAYGRRGGSLRRLFLEGNFLTGRPPPALLSGGSLDAGDLSDNCLTGCRSSWAMCKLPQKSAAKCRVKCRAADRRGG